MLLAGCWPRIGSLTSACVLSLMKCGHLAVGKWHLAVQAYVLLYAQMPSAKCQLRIHLNSSPVARVATRQVINAAQVILPCEFRAQQHLVGGRRVLHVEHLFPRT